MNRKIPDDAFGHYFGLGSGRSYEAVAEHYGVTKKAVTNKAKKEDWQDRLAGLEREAREKLNERAAETLQDMNLRHLKVLKYIQAKSIEALKSMPIESAMDAIKAYSLTLEKERLIQGEPSDRMAMDVAQVTKDEVRRLLTTAPETDENW